MRNGQALITILFFMAIGITVATAAVMVTLANAGTTSSYVQGEGALSAAEAGIENAMVRLLRDRAYVGETIVFGNATAVVQVTGDAQKTIRSQGRNSNATRTAVAQISYDDSVLRVTSWREEF